MKPRAVRLRGVFEKSPHCIVIYKNTWIQYLFTTQCFGFALHVHHHKPAQYQCSQCQKVQQEKKGSLGQKTLSDLWCFVDTVKCQRSSEKMPLLPFLLHCYILRILQFITAICGLLTCRCGNGREEEERQSPARNHNTSSAAIGFIPQKEICNTLNKLNFAHSAFNRSAHSPDVRWQTFSNKNADLSIHSVCPHAPALTRLTLR